MVLADKQRERREKYESTGIAKPIKKRKKVENLLEKLKILKKRKKKPGM